MIPESYNWPSVSTGSASAGSTDCRSKILGEKMLRCADVYYVLRPKMLAILNMYTLFSCHYSLNNSVTTMYIALTLH